MSRAAAVPAIAPAEAERRIGPEGGATYVDVRTVAEFAAGHPRGRVINVPIAFHHPTTGEEHPNPAFELVMRHACALDTPLVVGADQGDRTARAAAALEAAGYRDIAVMPTGMKGWRAAGLAVTRDNRDGISYVSLLTPARREQQNK